MKVLVVEDDASMRDLVRLHLNNNGYEVEGAEDAIVAGHLVVKHRPDLIIVDVHMPYMNGYEFVAALRGDPATRDIPIVFLTTDEDVSDKARNLGAAGFLVKPVTVNQLLSVVAAGLSAK